MFQRLRPYRSVIVFRPPMQPSAFRRSMAEKKRTTISTSADIRFLSSIIFLFLIGTTENAFQPCPVVIQSLRPVLQLSQRGTRSQQPIHLGRGEHWQVFLVGEKNTKILHSNTNCRGCFFLLISSKPPLTTSARLL